MNAPLLFINTPNCINDDSSQIKYDSRITQNFSFSPFEKQIKELALIYSNGVRIQVELTTNKKIYVGYITNYSVPNVMIKDDFNDYIINVNDIEKLNIKKIGV